MARTPLHAPLKYSTMHGDVGRGGGRCQQRVQMPKLEVDGAGAAASIVPIDRAGYMPAGVAVWLRYLEHWRVSYRSLAYMQVGRWWDGRVRGGGWWHSPGEQGHTVASLWEDDTPDTCGGAGW